MAENRRAGSRYRRVDGLTLRLDRRVACDNEIWSAEVLDGTGQGAGAPRVVVAGSVLDSERWTKL